MIRENTIIATGNVDSRPDYDYSDGITFRLFEIKDGADLSSKVYDLDGNVETLATVKRNGRIVEMEVKNLKNKKKKWEVVIYDKVKNIDGGDIKLERVGTRIVPTKENIKFELEGELNGR